MGNLMFQKYPSLSLPMSSSTMTTTMNPSLMEKLHRIKYYFASRTSAYDDIWNICYRLSDEIQEQVLDVFILTLIDHWDKELERYVLLCERCLILLDFDFERLETRQLFIYDYARFNSIKIGPLVYPSMALNYYNHRSRYAMRFQWDSQKPLNYRDYWNPWSKEIPWITLTQHPLATYIDDVLNEIDLDDDNGSSIDDQYFTKEYLQQIRRRFSLETFHDKFLEIIFSFQSNSMNYYNVPRLDQSLYGPNRNVIFNNQNDSTNIVLEEAVRNNILIEILHHRQNYDTTSSSSSLSPSTILHYSPVLCENYFNIPAMFYNRTNLGYYRLRLF